MSVAAMGWAKGRAPTIAGQAVLFALADYADEWGVTYVGQDTIASDCSCRKATVSQNLARLEELRLIGRVRRHDRKGRRTSDHIVLAPLAADRGGMLDADKRAVEKHPEDVVAMARGLDTPGVSRNDGLDTPHRSLDTRGVPEPSVNDDAERDESLSASGRARDRGKVDLPEEFPDELREHLKRVYRLLRDLAQREGAKAIKPVSLAYVVMARSRKPLVAAAHDCAAHWHGKHPKDVVACYRNWLDRTDDLADVERLDAPVASTNGRQRMNPDRPASEQEAELLRRFHERERGQQPTTKGASE